MELLILVLVFWGLSKLLEGKPADSRADARMRRSDPLAQPSLPPARTYSPGGLRIASRAPGSSDEATRFSGFGPLWLPRVSAASLREGEAASPPGMQPIRISIDYVDARGRASSRAVDALYVLHTRFPEERYLIAHCQQRQARRSFRLDRIRALSFDGSTFHSPAYTIDDPHRPKA